MQKKTEGICFAISAGICWGSMGVAAQVLMEDSGFTVGIWSQAGFWVPECCC